MASRSTERAHALGYPSYRALRNARAQTLGFTSFAEQHRVYQSPEFRKVRESASFGAPRKLKPHQLVDVYRHALQFKNRSNYAKDASRALSLHPDLSLTEFDALYKQATDDYAGNLENWMKRGRRLSKQYLDLLGQKTSEYVYWYH